jgi:UDP-glucuronate 4-epimerase
MKALVTGCAGFIGSHLTDGLLADGHEVLGVDMLLDNYSAAIKRENLARARAFEAFRFLRLDLSDAELAPLVEDCDVVFHLAAEPGVRSSWGSRFGSYERNNVLATQRLLETLKEWPEKRVVYASSSSVYGDAERLPTTEDSLPRPFSPYGVTKLAAEHLCSLYHRNFGLATVSLRYFSVYGPRQRPDMAFNRFCRAALAGDLLTVFGDGRQTRDFTFVADVVAATRVAAASPSAAGGVYNVGGGSRVSVNEALELIASFVGRPLDVRYVETERGDVRDTGADIAPARRDLGFRPATSVEEGLRAELGWMAKHSAPRPRARGRTAVGGREWLDPLVRELNAAPAPYTFFFRDDDVGWASSRLLSLLDVFAHYAVPLDLAVIPAPLDPALAARLRRRRESGRGILAFHQHGFTHANHELAGRPCEFGPARPAGLQRADIAAGARRLQALLGGAPTVFTPPWNRCTRTTGRCLLDLGFHVLVRDSSASPLELGELQELAVNVDWSARSRGQRIGRSEAARRLAAACRRGPTGVMLHHALMGREERSDVERLLELLAAHENARCVPLGSLVLAELQTNSTGSRPSCAGVCR